MGNISHVITALMHMPGKVQEVAFLHLTKGERLLRMGLAGLNPMRSDIPLAGSPTDVSAITSAIGKIQGYVVSIATALVVLMIIVAGVFIIVDRDVSTTKRGERLAFIKSILIGYAIVLGANFLVGLLINVMSGITSTNVTSPSISAPHP